MSGSIAISWADLPNELLNKISKCLHTETDSRRFRAVCNSWRSSTPPVKKFPPTPLKLPDPFETNGTYLMLTERTVYRLQPPECSDPNFWLVKIESSYDGISRVLNPVSHHQIELLPETKMPKVLNTLDFRVSEVCKCFTLHHVNPSKPNHKPGYIFAKKVAVSVGPNNDEYVIAAIDYYNNLWYIKSGDEKWTEAFDDPFRDNIFDIVNCKGQLCGIDRWGGAWLFDSVFVGKRITYNEHRGAYRRHLMGLFDGELVLVDEVTDEDEQICTCYGECHCNFPSTPARKAVEKIIIYRMDKSRAEWVKAKIEFDGIIFVGDDCSFSVSAQEFNEGCKGTRVFYPDPHILIPTGDACSECDCWYSSGEHTGRVDNFIPSEDVRLLFRELHGHNTGVFDFETGKVGSVLKFPEYAKIFWPPPSWLSRS